MDGWMDSNRYAARELGESNWYVFLSNDALLGTRSLRASSFMVSLNTVTCIELPQISECMIAIYDDGEWSVVAYLISHMKCGEATLPERL